jgi:hypothetical protein
MPSGPPNTYQLKPGACKSLHWVTTAIIIHNLIIDIRGASTAIHFLGNHGQNEEFEDWDGRDLPQGIEDEEGESQN